MLTKPDSFTFSQIHIDTARNSTDDFNLFHDKNKWNKIKQNPFGGPIILGFQLECLVENLVRKYRSDHGETKIIDENQLQFSNYQFSFVNAVKPEEPIDVSIKKSKLTSGPNTALGNRICIRTKTGIALSGYKHESTAPLFLADSEFVDIGNLDQSPDRSYTMNRNFFIKRKYMNTGNAKNFLSGSLVEHSGYFDELEDKVRFPEIFPVSLVSCALLEKASGENHNFEERPMVYTSHQISVDRNQIQKMKSNDVLHILVKNPETKLTHQGLGKSGITQQVYECYGLVRGNAVLFRAIIGLAALQEILTRLKESSKMSSGFSDFYESNPQVKQRNSPSI